MVATETEWKDVLDLRAVSKAVASHKRLQYARLRVVLYQVKGGVEKRPGLPYHEELMFSETTIGKVTEQTFSGVNSSEFRPISACFGGSYSRNGKSWSKGTVQMALKH